MYDDMLNKLERIKVKFVDEETIHSIFRDQYWEFMGYDLEGTKMYYIESPMGAYITLEIEEISLEELKAIPSERGEGKLGSSGK